MRLGPNLDVTRIRGTLEVELQDGRKGTVEVDLDVSSPLTEWGIQRKYHNQDDLWYRGPNRLESTTYSVTVPPSVHQEDPAFTLRVHTGEG